MKNQNPQEILNEILLRMKYDSSMTLSENKKIINEQRTPYYDSQGFLKYVDGPVAIPQGGVAASKVYPNLKPGEYPNYNFTLGATAKPAPFNKPQSMISPQNYVPTSTTPEGRKKELEWYSTKYMSNQNPKVVKDPGPKQNFDELAKQGNIPKNIDEIKIFQDFLDLYYSNWLIINNEKSNLNKDITKGYGIFGPSTKRMWNNSEVQKKYEKYLYGELKVKDKNKGIISPQNFVPTNMDNYQDELRQYVQNYSNVDYEKIQQVIARTSEFKKLKEEDKIDITVGIGSSSWDIQIPESSTLYYWTYEDHNYFEKFKNSVVFKSGSAEDWKNYLFPFGDTVTPNGEFYGTTPWKRRYMPVGKIKGFSFKSKTQTWTFKQSLTGEEFLEEFGTIINDNYVKYNWDYFLGKTWWEENGPTLLNVGSLIVAVVFPATWPALLISAGLDLAAAKMQMDMGDSAGAQMSALLSLTPFVGKLGIKVNTEVAQNLLKKFSKATNKSQVDLIATSLNKDELKVLGDLRELGQMKSQLEKLKFDPEIQKAIKDVSKQSPILTPKVLKKAGVELSAAGSIFAYNWKNLTQQILEEMTYKQFLDQYVIGLINLVKDSKDKAELESMIKDSSNQKISKINNIFKKLLETAKKEGESQLKERMDEISNLDALIEQEENKSLDEPIGQDTASKILPILKDKN